MSVLGRISVGVVLDGDLDVESLMALNNVVENSMANAEIVVVANGISYSKTHKLFELVNEMSDTTIHFLEGEVDRDFARLIIIDNAIGDWVLLAELDDLDLEHWKQLLSTAKDGFEVVMAHKDTVSSRGGLQILRRAFLSFYRLISKLPISDDLPTTRLYSRAAALYLIGRPDNIMLLKCANLGPGFSAKQVVRKNVHALNRDGKYSLHLEKAYRALYNVNALPIRSIIFVALFSAAINVVFSTYTIFVYLSKWEIPPGWTTQSLQISIMFFLMSILFAMLGERIVTIEKSVSHKLRYSVIREFRSPRSRAAKTRNIVSNNEVSDKD